MTFVLTDYNGLFLWLKADALALADTNPVSSWTDSSGRANHATQATGANQPLYRTNRINSLPSVVFDGSNDSLATAAIDLTAREDLTLYAVVKSASLASATQMILENSTAYFSNAGAWALFRESTTNALNAATMNGAAGSWESWTDPGTAFVLLTMRVLRGNRKMTGQLFVNGAPIGMATADGSPDTSRMLLNQPIYIGARAGTSLFLNGEIAEIAAYWTAHEPDKRMIVETSLATKYALTLNPVTVAAAFDGHSHAEGDGPNTKARTWPFRAMTGVTQQMDWIMTARSGTTLEKFADDRIPRERWLENELATRIVTSQCASNDLTYGFSVAKTQDHLTADWARLLASNATHRWTRFMIDRKDAGRDVNWDANRTTVNAWARLNLPAGIYASDDGLDPFLGYDGAANDTNWFHADKVHVNEHPGETYIADAFRDYLTGTVGLTRWLPSAASGLALWLDAETIAGSDGDLIATWEDQSGNARHATAAGGLRPTLKVNVLGWPGTPHRNAVRFAGSQGMTLPSIDFTATSALTVAMVYNSTVAGTDQVLIERTTNYNTPTGASAVGFAILRTSGNVFSSSLKGDVGYNTQTLASAGSTTRVGITVLDKSQVANREVLLRVNATEAAPTGASNNTNVWGNVATYLGSRAAASLFLTGDLAEVLIYNRRLTIEELRRLENYLAMKWGTH